MNTEIDKRSTYDTLKEEKYCGLTQLNSMVNILKLIHLLICHIIHDKTYYDIQNNSHYHIIHSKNERVEECEEAFKMIMINSVIVLNVVIKLLAICSCVIFFLLIESANKKNKRFL